MSISIRRKIPIRDKISGALRPARPSARGAGIEVSEARALTFSERSTDKIKLGRRDGAQRKEYDRLSLPDLSKHVKFDRLSLPEPSRHVKSADPRSEC